MRDMRERGDTEQRAEQRASDDDGCCAHMHERMQAYATGSPVSVGR